MKELKEQVDKSQDLVQELGQDIALDSGDMNVLLTAVCNSSFKEGLQGGVRLALNNLKRCYPSDKKFQEFLDKFKQDIYEKIDESEL